MFALRRAIELSSRLIAISRDLGGDGASSVILLAQPFLPITARFIKMMPGYRTNIADFHI